MSTIKDLKRWYDCYEHQYMGACECENCGRWYNLFGQEIMPPEMWRGECIDEDW